MAATLNGLLHIFPEEVWEAILERLDDTQDILNFFSMCPTLTRVSQGRQWSWLIELVIPLLPKFPISINGKNCRLVSKRWKRAVDWCYETYPERHPYKSSKIFRMTDPQLTVNTYLDLVTNFHRFLQFAGVELESTSGSHNPFPGRRVQFDMEHFNEFGEKTILLLHKFGHHIQHATIWMKPLPDKVVSQEKAEEVLLSLFSGLVCMTNLKYLKIMVLENSYLSCIEAPDFKRLLTTGLGSVPFRLETFEMWTYRAAACHPDIPFGLVTSLVNAVHLQKLSLNAECWDSCYGHMFPNLTDLCVTSVFNRDTLSLILRKLTLSRLRKLGIEATEYIMEDGLDLIFRLPIESLELNCAVMDNEEYLSRQSTLPPVNLYWHIRNNESIRFLQIVASYTSRFSFLTLLPNLEFLKVQLLLPRRCACCSPDRTAKWTDGKCTGSFFRDALHKFVRSGFSDHSGFLYIWDNLPKLTMLVICDYEQTFHVVRESKTKMYYTLQEI